MFVLVQSMMSLSQLGKVIISLLKDHQSTKVQTESATAVSVCGTETEEERGGVGDCKAIRLDGGGEWGKVGCEGLRSILIVTRINSFSLCLY